MNRHSLLENLTETHDLFEIQNKDSKTTRHNNPQYWLQQDTVQITTFQYNFVQKIISNDDAKPHIKVFPKFLKKFFIFNF